MRSDLNLRTPSRRVVLGALGVLAAGAAGAAAFRSAARMRGLQTLTRAGMAFQTPVAFTLAGPEAPALEAAMRKAFAALREVENASSVYRPDSDVARLNRDSAIDRPHPHLVTLLRYAKTLSQETDGAFDITVQPLWDLWAEHAARGERPSPAALRETVARVDWRGVTIAGDRVALARPGMAVTLNSINQGYAADVTMAALVDAGIADAFVDTGEFGARGRHPQGRDWRLGVVDPRDTSRLAFTLDPFRRFSATSGDYETYFSPDFRDHHIFDPRTGTSPPDWSQITVCAPSGLEADGLSTALFVLDAPAAAGLLARHPACSARFFDKAGRPSLLVEARIGEDGTRRG